MSDEITRPVMLICVRPGELGIVIRRRAGIQSSLAVIGIPGSVLEEREAIDVEIGEDRRGAGHHDRKRRVRGRERGRDHLIAWADPERA